MVATGSPGPAFGTPAATAHGFPWKQAASSFSRAIVSARGQPHSGCGTQAATNANCWIPQTCGRNPFLWEREGWQPCWTDRPKLPESDITALADWQRRHLHVRWVECAAPWGLERDVVHAMRPPLNRDHNQCHPFSRAVGKAREVLRDTARLRPC